MAKNQEGLKEETKAVALKNESDFIHGLLESYTPDDQDMETKKIEIFRQDKLMFAFSIKPLTEQEYEKCKRKHTKYVKNKQLGMKIPEETNNVKFRSELIYQATVLEDRKLLWDNRAVWSGLEAKGLDILTATDVIDVVLKPGERTKIIDAIEELSGYEGDLEEVTKN